MAEEGRGSDRYKLAAIRDARARDEHGKRGDLADAVGDARAAHARLNAARARTQTARDALAAAVSARDEVLVAGPSPVTLVLAERVVARRRHELVAAAGEELRAESAYGAHEGAIDVARQTLARARADREVIERHFARWRESRKKLAERRED